MLDDTRFEIRRGIKNHERHNAMLQASYDTVDRMATIFGDLTFGELLTKPFKVWIPKIMPNVQAAADYGLVDRPEEVVELFERIVKGHGDESFRSMAEYMSSDEARLSREIYSPVYKLWIYHGIRLPEFSRNPDDNAKVRDAIEAVIEHAADLDYKLIFLLPRSKDTKLAFLAVRAAADLFIINLPLPNGLCCSCGGTGCICTGGRSSDWCSQMNPTTCAAGSNTCGAGPDIPIS